MPVQLDAGFPRTFGPYALLGSYGRGGMGEVFLAARGGAKGDELCVVKTLRNDLGNDKGYVRRFLDEARVVVQLNHRNICAVFDVGKVGDEYFMAMEHVAGVNVRELLAACVDAKQKLSPAAALYIACEMLDALAYAHSLALELVHRDVSPHNVMVGFDGDVKLIDFGLAESVLKQEQTESQVVLGKVAYMSPEYARGEAVDASCDQYAAGVVLYEMLTGDRFYGDMSTPAVWAIAGHGSHRPRKWATLPSSVQPILARALSADPKERWPSCAALRDALSAVRTKEFASDARRELRATLAALFAAKLKRMHEIEAGYVDATARIARAPAAMIAQRAIETQVLERPHLDARAAMFAAGGLVVVAAALAAFLATHKSAAHDDLTATRALDAGSAVHATPTSTSTGTARDAGTMLASTATPASTPTPTPTSTPKPAATHDAGTPPRVATAPPEAGTPHTKPRAPKPKAQVDAGTVEAKPQPKAALTLAESLAILRKCNKPCAPMDIGLAETNKLDEESFRLADKRALIDRCVQVCRAE